MQQTEEKVLNVASIQKALKAEQFDGWLFYYFHDNDALAHHILGLSADHFVSRRWFYYIPAAGEPVKLVHRIEMDALDKIPGRKVVYLGWRQLEEKLKELLPAKGRVAMQYSPNNAIPYISRVDGGTIELVRSTGVEVVSSANLVQTFEAVWSDTQLKSHLKAATNLRAVIFDAFTQIASCINNNRAVNEYEIQQYICERFAQLGMTTNSPPIVAVNEHSGSPHYQPTHTKYSPIKKGDFVLLDIWAKMKEPSDAVYADITWTGFVGDKVPEQYERIFQIVSGARDAAVIFIRKALSEKRVIHGWEVDDVTRRFITERGHGDDFVHRTGHSIGLEVHANGANIDNLETRDERRLIPRTCFSIEPGVYLPEFGVRSEIDVYINESEAIIGGEPIQTAVIPILTLK